MNLSKQFILMAIALVGTTMAFPAFAETEAEKEVVRLPVLTVLAEPELREEAGVVPYQEETARRKALQHRMMQIEAGTRATVIDPTVVANLDILPIVPAPNLSNLPPLLQQHVLDIAHGLQSSDPRNGLYIMLQPFGIDRNTMNVQISREQINLGNIDRSLPNGMPQK